MKKHRIRKKLPVVRAAYKKQTEIGTVVAVTTVTKFPYTMETLAAFLGFIQPNDRRVLTHDEIGRKK
jgi:hypothetical protein